MSETSTPYILASISTTVAGNETISELELEPEDYDIIEKERINGRTFFKITKEEYERHEMKSGPATALVDIAKECKEKRCAVFSYCSFKEDIKRRLGNMGSILAGGSEAMRCEYISTILHASLYIVKRITDKELTLAPQLEIVGEESTGRVDYAIKSLEELLCITEGKLHQVVMGFAQNLIQCESALQPRNGILFFSYSDGISSTSKDLINIRFSESALKEESEEEKDLRKNVKRVMEVIDGLFKDRLECVYEEIMPSELELLKQRITELESENVEIAELRKENVEIRKENTDLRMKSANFGAERTELKRRIAETLRMTEEERTRRNAENVKLRATIEDGTVADRNDNSNNNSSNFNLVADHVPTVSHYEKPLVDTSLPEDKETDAFLNESLPTHSEKKMSQDLNSVTLSCNSTSSEEKIFASQVPIEQKYVTRISETAGPGKSNIDEALQRLAQ
ncbi:5808_t:CDS:2 [Acaulospora colombiana]|uniref:5808_t:CDS:1 n=1 Tax=Acaulospora colombiana TaxID=27376 RepID=A0ACA9LBR6_9GLOM|nr:5808_t:CDS:2 [Acaulospora colombiana]